MKLPEKGVMDSVYTVGPVRRKGWLLRLLCRHLRATEFTHIDYRAGPGSFSDTWVGAVCQDCGHVIKRRAPTADDYVRRFQ